MPRFALLLAGICLLTLACPLRAGDAARTARETGQFVSEGTFRGFALPGVAAAQHAKALAHWKRLYEKEAPTHVETGRFLLYGTMPEKRLAETGTLLDKTYAVAAKALELEATDHWTGKLAVFVVEERGAYV